MARRYGYFPGERRLTDWLVKRAVRRLWHRTSEALRALEAES